MEKNGVSRIIQKKSKIMMFGKSNSCHPLKMYEKDLEVVKEYKYLGITVVTGDSVAFSNIRPLRLTLF